MTDYTKTTDFTSKDSLPSGDSGKIIRGAEFGTEFDNIQTAVNSKSNIENPSFTGNITVTGTVDGRDIAADGTKLDTIETSADVTDTANVTAAGAVMDSELTDITAVKALNQGVATTDSPTFAAVTSTGNITVDGTVDGRDVATDGTKLDTVETNADVTDTTNVTAAGALMDSEVTNLDQVKAFDSADYATAAQGTTADNALPKTGGAMTGAITTNSTFDGRDVATDGTKLDGIEALADVTDTANVTAAGALMDSELTSEASVKALNQGVATTDSPTFAGATVNGTVEFDGLSGTGAVTVTDILDQDDMSGNSATALATQQSIKSYVDSQVATSDTLAEVLANGNTTGGTDVAFGDNDKALFGAGSDLQIYHDGSNSIIKDVGDGVLQIGGASQVEILNNTLDENMAVFKKNNAVELYYDNAKKFETTSTGIDVTGTAVTDGITSDGVVTVRVESAGATAEALKVYNTSNSNNSQVDVYFGSIDYDTTGRGLRIEAGRDSGADGIATFYSVDQAEHSDYEAIKILTDGGVTLSHLGSNKLATSSTGIDVTGTATVDGLTVQTAQGDIVIPNSSSSIDMQRAGNNYIYASNAAGNLLLGSGASFNRLNIDNSGDISFYEDTGTTAKMVWDASAESLGIGTSSPSSYGHSLVVAKDASGGATYATITNTNANQFLNLGINADVAEITWDNADSLAFGTTAASTDEGQTFEAMRISSSGNVGIGTDSPSSELEISGSAGPLFKVTSTATGTPTAFVYSSTNGADFGSLTNHPARIYVNNAERMRIDASGNLLVGTTNTLPQTLTSGGGFCYAPDSSLRIARQSDGTGQPIVDLNNTGSDDELIRFRTDGAVVGSIRSQSSLVTDIILDPRSNNYATGHGIGGTQVSGVPKIIPRDGSGNALDAGIDLGHSNNRFKDLYLSGGVYLGGTASANKLDDYEEGTFTPTVYGTGTAGTASYTQRVGTYTKVGNLVYVQVYVVFSSFTGTSAMRISGLPFTAEAGAYENHVGNIILVNIPLPAGTIQVAPRAIDSQTYIDIQATLDNAGFTPLLADAAGEMIISITYRSA